MSRARASAGASAGIAAGLAAVAFIAKGGTELGRTTGVEIALVLVGAAAVAAALLWARRDALDGGLALALLAALTAVTALSVVWSIVPDLSFVEAGRMLAYLAVFAGALAAARLAPRAAPELLAALLGACVVVAGYALASRVWPGSLAQNELYARIGQPFGYWNAVGASAAMGVPAGLWLGSRRQAPVAARAASYPALGVLLLTAVLTQSRGALAAGVIGIGLWFAIVPLRLRSLPVLLLPAAATAPVAAWALSKPAFTDDFRPLAVRESVAGDFGLLVLLLLAVLLVAGLAVNLGLQRGMWPVHLRRRAGVAALVAAALVPLALFTGVAFSSRGLSGTISHQVHNLTNENAETPTGANRLTAASSSRAGYWREAGHIFADRPGLGAGAGTFGIARLRYRRSELVSRHAHGFIPQAMADTGLLGLGVSVALLLAWLAAAVRATALVPRSPRRRQPAPRRDWTPDRVALVALVLVVVVFGIQSAVDWIWFVTFPAAAALAAAGFVAGRGPLLATGPVAPAPPPTRRLALPPVDAGRAVAAAAVAVVALICAWAIWQPERSSEAANHALDLSAAGNYAAASKEAVHAGDVDPLSSTPPLVLASVQAAAGRDAAAAGTLERAVLRYPGEPATWLRLASFQLTALHRPALASHTVQGALYLDPRSKAARSLFLQARVALRAQQAARTPVR